MGSEGQRVADVLTLVAGGLTDPLQATLQGPSPCISYEASSEFNSVGYADRAGFEFAMQYAQETKGVADLEQAGIRGSELISMLYTYRSIARALPTVSGSDAHKKAMYSASFEVLHPYISRIKQLMHFKDDLVGTICTNLELLVRVDAKKKSEPGSIPCEGLEMQMLRALDMLVVMDSLKDTKACLTNDFATYKRAFQHCHADIPNADSITLENARLQPFLSNKESLMSFLKSSLEKVPGHELVLASMANLCLECLEQEWYLLPAEKHRFLRGAAYLLWLLDAKGGVNAFKHKLVRKERFSRYFKRNPVVPLYGDMHANLSAVLQRCPNFHTVEPTEWISVSKKDQEHARQEYDIISYLPRLRVLVAEYIGSLNELLHRVTVMGGGERCQLERDAQTDLAMRLTWCVLRGCRLMSIASAQLQEFMAWKCANMVSHEDLERRAGKVGEEEVTEYERAMRFNFSDAERTAMVELLGLVRRCAGPRTISPGRSAPPFLLLTHPALATAQLKGLHSALHQAEGDPEILIRRALHEQTQHFVHSVMGTTTRKAVKHDRKLLKQSLMQLRHLVADWTDGVPIMNEEVIAGKDFKNQEHTRDYPARSVPPSDTQLWLMRAMVRSMYDEQSPHIKSHGLSAPDISKETVKEMRAFYASTALFPYLLRLSETLSALSNVSYLWMREFYLELGKRTQFPISMSMPWILTEHILNQRNGRLMPLLFAPMDTYNDAAIDALHVHKQQFLFVEIEAETNLCFDQVLFGLAEQVFSHYKTRAASMLMNNTCTLTGLEAQGDTQARRTIGKSWYETLLQQRNVTLIGRSVDLAQLLGQRMNTMLRQSIETAVARFESKDAAAVLELDFLLRTIKLTHSLLEKALPNINSFEQAFAETNETVTFLSFSSRIANHAMKEVLDDLLPNFAYRADGHLFQRPPQTDFTEQPERDPAPKITQQSLLLGTRQLNAEFAMKQAMMQGCFGASHAEALVEVLGVGGMQQLLAQLSKHMEDLLTFAISSYVTALQEALPANTKMPSHMYGSKGCYGYYDLKLADLRSYEELHSGVLHNCRRLGNAFVLLQMLEGSTQVVSMKTLLQLPISRAIAPEPMSAAATAVSSAWGQAAEESDMVLMAQQLSILCAPLASEASLLSGILTRLALALTPQKDQWLGEDTPETDMSTYETTKAFHRVWSSVQFLFCTANFDTQMGHMDNITLFGEGVPTAGCLILHMLGQRRRFELFDFSLHTFAVHMSDTSSFQHPDATVQLFLQHFALLTRSNERMFILLQALDAPTVYNAWRRM